MAKRRGAGQEEGDKHEGEERRLGFLFGKGTGVSAWRHREEQLQVAVCAPRWARRAGRAQAGRICTAGSKKARCLASERPAYASRASGGWGWGFPALTNLCLLPSHCLLHLLRHPARRARNAVSAPREPPRRDRQRVAKRKRQTSVKSGGRPTCLLSSTRSPRRTAAVAAASAAEAALVVLSPRQGPVQRGEERETPRLVQATPHRAGCGPRVRAACWRRNRFYGLAELITLISVSSDIWKGASNEGVLLLLFGNARKEKGSALALSRVNT